MVVGVMQISSLQRKLDQERKSLNSQVHDLERKLDVLRQELVVAESTLSAKDSELAVLKNNLKELEDLREMKEVLILYIL
jgi:septal ring factor EnvC (AmiA/AmiB activator)